MKNNNKSQHTYNSFEKCNTLQRYQRSFTFLTFQRNVSSPYDKSLICNQISVKDDKNVSLLPLQVYDLMVYDKSQICNRISACKVRDVKDVRSLESITKIRNLPGENLCESIIEKVKIVNHAKKQKKKSFSWYKKSIADIFGCQSLNKKIKSVKYKNFYGGFVLAEGSINVSAKKSKGALFGFIIDPEFSITQHVNGFPLLLDALSLFETGSIHYKSGSNSTLVYRIDNRKSLMEKVIPFWETYIFPYISTEEKERLILFKKILFFLEEKKHKDIHFFVDAILPIWDKLRKQKGQKNQSFSTLEAATLFALKKEKEKRKGSSETIRDLI